VTLILPYNPFTRPSLPLCSPIVTLFAPSSIHELADLLRIPGSHYLPCGSRTKVHWGFPRPAPYLSTVNLNQVIAYAPSDLTITVEAGLLYGELQKVLAEKGQFWPVDPLYPDQATVGGVIATADTGSLRHRYGGVRDLVLGIEFVRADGERAKGGGRVVKNVAGYDLMKLLTGSRGRLAVISQVTLRLYPSPPAIAQHLWTGDLPDIAALGDRILHSTLTPVAVDLLSPTLINQDTWGIEITWHGSHSEAQQATVSQWATPLTPLPPLSDLTSPWTAPGVLSKLGLLPATGIPVLHDLQSTFPAMRLQWHRRVGLGRLWLPTWDPQSFLEWRKRCHQAGGFLQLLAAHPDLLTQVDPEGIPAAQGILEHRLKQIWDPQGRFP